jgi:hypothetical protein
MNSGENTMKKKNLFVIDGGYLAHNNLKIFHSLPEGIQRLIGMEYSGIKKFVNWV